MNPQSHKIVFVGNLDGATRTAGAAMGSRRIKRLVDNASLTFEVETA
jgi:hypothetical protein